MRHGKGWFGFVLVSLASVVVLVACATPGPATDPDNGGVGSGNGAGNGTVAPSSGTGMPGPELDPMVAPVPYPEPGAEWMGVPSVAAPEYDFGYGYSYGYTSPAYPPPTNLPPAGIHVMGSGAVKMSPDLAVLSVGVDARAGEVETARRRAAEAMDAVMRALEAHGVPERDIQTQHFSIYPEYTWREVVDRETGYRHGEQVLLGYRVTNNIQVKVRDLDGVGGIIDAIAGAGGDTVRVHHVSFTLEDPREVESQARELAVKEARAKAEQMAAWAGEGLGKLLYLVETGVPSPVRLDMAVPEPAPADASAMPRTPITPGDLEVRVTVQGVWDVQ